MAEEPAPLYPQIVDARHASPAVKTLFESFFTAKSLHDVTATVDHFSPRVVTYTDTTLGWGFDGLAAIHAVFAEHMPKWPQSALSYPTRILGDTRSALVGFTDTPELFGGELRILGAVDFADGKVVRWVDYWDATGFDEKLYKTLRTKAEKFPGDFKEAVIGTNASPKIVTIATRVQKAFAAGDAQTAALLFGYDAVYEDMTLRAQLLGRAAIERYLGRVLSKAPFGTGSRLRHVVGSVLGGGFEWYGSPHTGVPGGITALELDQEGKVQRLTSVYDGRTFGANDRRALVLLSMDR